MNAMCKQQQVSDNRLKIPPYGKLYLQLDSRWARHWPSTLKTFHLQRTCPRAAVMAAAAYFCSRSCLHVLFSCEPFEDPVSLPPSQVRKQRPRG